jgi:hypothetical protein
MMTTFTAAIHGAALQLQDPIHVRSGPSDGLTTANEPVAACRRFGWGTEVRGNRWPAWLHFPFDLSNTAETATVREIGVRFSTRGGGVLTAIHLWDGHERLFFNDRVDAPPLVTVGGNRIRQEARFYRHNERLGTPAVVRRMAIGVSLQWTFSTAIEGDVLSVVTFHEVTLTYDA